jgi:hypothetical protein
MASGTSLYTRMNIVSPVDLSFPDSVLVYYIASFDGNVYKRPLSENRAKMVYALHSKNDNDRLFVRANKSDTNHWDLVARLERKDLPKPHFVNVLTNLTVEATPDWRGTFTDPPQYEGTWMSFGHVQSLGSATNSLWEFWSGFWPMEGLRAWNKTTSQSVHFAYETPFGSWTVRNAVHLPSDKVLFQLGEDQICIFDPVLRQVALLWHGRGPVALIEKHPVTRH